ncbi:MAG: nitroreductase family protein [Muribaculaceae bacterium]|nr:nitroreductase family protein [Muribaculaceae bacterium]
MKASNWINILLGAGIVAMAGLLVTNSAALSNENTQEEQTSSTTNQSAIDCIMTRSSVRTYTDREIPDSVVQTLLKAGMAAPTAMNKQPWQFVVVTDQATRDAISETDDAIRSKNAAVVIVACGDLEKEGDGPGAEFWIQDVSAATENILLAAHAQGLGAVWCGIYPISARVENISKILELPEHIIPLSAICIGYPDGEQRPKDKWNPEAIHYGKF